MKKWTMRILGGLNILQFPAGIYFTAVLISWHWRHWPMPPSNIYWYFFYLFFGLNLALTALLAYLGWRLIWGDERAILITSLVLFLEIVSFFTSTVVFWLILPKYVPVFDIPGDLLAPQVLTGYPVIGLVITLLLAIRIRQKTVPKSVENLPAS